MKQTVLSELHRLAQLNGGVLLPSTVVDAARDAASPLHGQFEWDDSEAAERYRLWQARQLIRVTVRMIKPEEPNSAARVFVSLSTDRNESGGYRVLADVLSNERMRAQLMEDARIEMRAFQRKYSDLTELANVFVAMEKAMQQTAA